MMKKDHPPAKYLGTRQVMFGQDPTQVLETLDELLLAHGLEIITYDMGEGEHRVRVAKRT